MEKVEINIEQVATKKDVKPLAKRKRKPIPKKVMIYTTREKVEINDSPHTYRFNSMNDYI